MSVFQRVSDIISANLNEMIEKFEDPAKMLKQAMGEMDAAIAEAKRDVAKAIAGERLLAKELAEHEGQAQQWAQRAERAVVAGDDDVARKALTRRQEHDCLRAALSDQHAAAVVASQVLRRQFEAMQAKLAEAQRRFGTLSARNKAAQVRSRLELGVPDPRWNTRAFAKFDRLRGKVEQAEAEADALRELSAASSAASAPSRVTSRGEVEVEVEAELLELKQKLRDA